MYRLPASGRVIVTGAASRSNTPGRVERVAVHPNHVLLVDRGLKSAEVDESPQPASRRAMLPKYIPSDWTKIEPALRHAIAAQIPDWTDPSQHDSGITWAPSLSAGTGDPA